MSNNHSEMTILTIAQVYCLVMAIPTGLGILWFSGSYSALYIAVALFVLFIQVIISIEPQKYCEKKSSLTSIAFCGFVSCFFLVYQIYKDFTIPNGPDRGAISFRSLLIISLIALSIDLLKKSPNQTIKSDEMTAGGSR